MSQMWSWETRRWMVALGVGTVAAIAVGVPTGIVETSFYTRMTPVTWWDYPVWAVSALLLGLTAATYVRSSRGAAPPAAGRTLGGGVLTAFAVGCPICNKLVVALLGVGGALDYWAPLQPLLGMTSIVILALALRVRLRGERQCELVTG